MISAQHGKVIPLLPVTQHHPTGVSPVTASFTQENGLLTPHDESLAETGCLEPDVTPLWHR